MYELYLNEKIKEELLNYDYEHSEINFDTIMYYVSNSENQILYDIIYGLMYDDNNTLEKIGFKKEDIKIIDENDINIYSTNDEYYLKKVD